MSDVQMAVERNRALLTERRAKILLLVFVITACLSAAEIYLRLTSPHIIRKGTPAPVGEYDAGDFCYFMDSFSGRRLIPNSHIVRVWDDGRRVPIDINSRGFRDEEIPEQKEPGEKRVLVLGDSIAFGGVVPVEDTYTKHMEGHLKRKGQIRCINGGVDGVGIKDYVDILTDQGLAVVPDIVVVGFYLNDGNPPDRIAAGLANPGFVRRHSILAQTIYRAYKFQQYRVGKMEEARMYEWLAVPPPDDWRMNRASLLQYAQVAKKDWGSAWEPDTWAGIETQMKRLKLLSEKHDFKVILVAFPIAFQVYSEYVEDLPQQRLRMLAQKHQFHFMDLLPLLRASGRDTTLFDDHCHLTKEGHSVVGDALADFLSDHFSG